MDFSLNPNLFFSIHLLLEVVGIAVSFSIFSQGWIIFSQNMSKQRLLFSATFLAVGLFDLMHIVTFSGAPFGIQGISSSSASWFAIFGRMTVAISIPLIILLPKQENQTVRRKKYYLISLVFFSLITWFLFTMNSPKLLIQGQGATTARQLVEFIIMILNFFAFGVLFYQYRVKRNRIVNILMVAMISLSLGSLGFSYYHGNYSFIYLLAHLSKAIGYLCLLYGVFIVVINEPYVRQKQLESEISRLDQLNVVGEMAATIAHEVRNPMTTVKGFLQILGQNETSPKHKEYYKIMIEELDRANMIIQEFLSLARNKGIHLIDGDLNQILNTLAPLIVATAVDSDKFVEFKLGNIGKIRLDEKEIRQLILNLTRNGLESMEPGKTIVISTFEDYQNIVLSVKDEGHGIDKSVVEKIGTPFLTTKDNGTGLGLPVCFQIVERHNAKIKYETSAQGTTFFVHFPKLILTE